MLRQTLVTTVRTGADVWTQTTDQIPRLFPSACLHMVDHHLHVSGILPRRPNATGRRIYDHAWLCASQSVTVWPCVTLLDTQQVTSHVWVKGVGSSSLQLGNALTVSNDDGMDDASSPTILATAQRLFVRRTWDGGAAPFTDVESTRFRNECGPTPAQTAMEEQVPALPRINTRDMTEGALAQPTWTVPVGTSHINFGAHANHAFLAETAHHALEQCQTKQVATLILYYMAEVLPGSTLRCHPQQVMGEQDHVRNFMVVTTTKASSGTASPWHKPVMLAEAIYENDGSGD